MCEKKERKIHCIEALTTYTVGNRERLNEGEYICRRNFFVFL